MQTSDTAERAMVAIGKLAQQRLRARRIVLFGSRARGEHRPTSDIDLMIDTDATDAAWARFCADVADLAPTLLHIDLVRADRMDADLRDQIAREGRELHVS